MQLFLHWTKGQNRNLRCIRGDVRVSHVMQLAYYSHFRHIYRNRLKRIDNATLLFDSLLFLFLSSFTDSITWPQYRKETVRSHQKFSTKSFFVHFHFFLFFSLYNRISFYSRHSSLPASHHLLSINKFRVTKRQQTGTHVAPCLLAALQKIAKALWCVCHFFNIPPLPPTLPPRERVTPDSSRPLPAEHDSTYTWTRLRQGPNFTPYFPAWCESGASFNFDFCFVAASPFVSRNRKGRLVYNTQAAAKNVLCKMEGQCCGEKVQRWKGRFFTSRKGLGNTEPAKVDIFLMECLQCTLFFGRSDTERALFQKGTVIGQKTRW